MRLQKAGVFVVWVLIGIGSIFVISKIFNVNDTGEISGVIEGKDAEASVSGGKTVFDTRSTGTMDPGDVVIDVKPVVTEDGKIRVNLSANTHSIELRQFDLSQITTLEYDGKVLRPVKADRIGGHHARGRIIFETNDNPKSFRIVIRGIPNVQERVYEWKEG